MSDFEHGCHAHLTHCSLADIEGLEALADGTRNDMVKRLPKQDVGFLLLTHRTVRCLHCILVTLFHNLPYQAEIVVTFPSSVQCHHWGIVPSDADMTQMHMHIIYKIALAPYLTPVVMCLHSYDADHGARGCRFHGGLQFRVGYGQLIAHQCLHVDRDGKLIVHLEQLLTLLLYALWSALIIIPSPQTLRPPTPSTCKKTIISCCFPFF